MRVPKPAAQVKRSASIAALIVIIFGSSLIYAWVALDTASKLQQQSALEQNRFAAEMSSRLLDEQWQDLQAVLDQLSHHSSIGDDLLQHKKLSLQSQVRFCVDLVPALELAAVYDVDGRLAYGYPANSVTPADAHSMDWFKRVKRRNLLYQGNSYRMRLLPGQPEYDVTTVSVPIYSGKQVAGYMFTLFRVGDLNRWLANLGLAGSDLYVVNNHGAIVDATINADRKISFERHKSFQLAMRHESGSRVSERFYSNQGADVGYAYVIHPGWAVIVVRPESVGIAPARSMVIRLVVMAALALLVLATGVTLMLRQYRTQQELAASLVEQNKALLMADQMKSDFLANASHDLRTPLAGLQISISSMLDPDLNWGASGFRENLRLASDGVDQIISRVRNLLEMSRLEAHSWPLNQQVCDLTDIVGSALEQTKSLMEGRKFILTFPPDPLLLECDPTQIETVVVNLLENANKYSPSGLPITLVGTEEAGYVRLSVKDCGPGIDEADYVRVFEKFYRAKSTQTVGGAGLGLAICKSIIAAHNGAIGVSNIYDKGTVAGADFWFILRALEHRSRVPGDTFND